MEKEITEGTVPFATSLLPRSTSPREKDNGRQVLPSQARDHFLQQDGTALAARQPGQETIPSVVRFRSELGSQLGRDETISYNTSLFAQS